MARHCRTGCPGGRRGRRARAAYSPILRVHNRRHAARSALGDSRQARLSGVAEDHPERGGAKIFDHRCARTRTDLRAAAPYRQWIAGSSVIRSVTACTSRITTQIRLPASELRPGQGERPIHYGEAEPSPTIVPAHRSWDAPAHNLESQPAAVKRCGALPYHYLNNVSA